MQKLLDLLMCSTFYLCFVLIQSFKYKEGSNRRVLVKEVYEYLGDDDRSVDAVQLLITSAPSLNL